MASLGYAGYLAFSLKRLVHDEGVLRTFMRRLPPRGRRIFQVRHQFACSPGLVLSGFALLGQTGAMLPSDGFSLVRPVGPGSQPLRCCCWRSRATAIMLEDKAAIEIGMPVELQPRAGERARSVSGEVVAGTRKLGFLEACRRRPFRRWLESRRVTGVIERLERQGRPARSSCAGDPWR
ncbi:MAG: hypothetical protein R3C69_00190 [Geminicoccaceae bacterium]